MRNEQVGKIGHKQLMSTARKWSPSDIYLRAVGPSINKANLCEFGPSTQTCRIDSEDP